MSNLDLIFSQLKTIISTIVIKNERTAKTYETLEISREADKFISASLKQDTFRSYPTFDIESVTNAGVTDISLAQYYALNKNTIPDDLREEVLRQQRRRVIENYNEQNNYYRMLNGLPAIEDLQFIYIERPVAEELLISYTTPIHELPTEDIEKLEKTGYLAKLIVSNPTKLYLRYLGNYKISIVRARSAKNFTILRMSQDVTESLYEECNIIYDECREYFMSVIYNKDYGSRYSLYDNFIAMCIMFMAIQRLIVATFKQGINRDFYDTSSIQMMFQSYNVPFIENLPIEYQRLLVKNLNNLLRYKSTDKVLYDICSLLGFERIKIFKYLLVKEHKTDETGNPLFIYKEVTNDDGSKSIVEDPEKMYDLYFQAVDIKERNTVLALSDKSSRLDYDQVVMDDPYWWDDDDEMKKHIYDTEFNYVESKYLNMNIMYKMTEMLFEVIYVFRMILDKKIETSNIEIELPKLFSNKSVDLFTATVFLCALVSKKNKMAGDIISTPTKVLSVMGFNFKADLTVVRQFIQENSDVVDQSILNYISSMDIYDPSDINALFNNIQSLNELITHKLGTTQNIKEYRAYKYLYNTLLVTDDMSTMFTKSDGEIATTFLDYLEDKDVVLSTFVTTQDSETINIAIEHVLFRLNNLATDLKYLYIVNDSNNVLLNAVITLIRFFKSYTTDLSSFNIMYLMNSTHFNMIKMIEDINMIQSNMILPETDLSMDYKDSLSYSAITDRKSMIDFVNTNIVTAYNYRDERNWSKDKLKRLLSTLKLLELDIAKDYLYILFTAVQNKDKLSPEERLWLTSIMKDSLTIDLDNTLNYIKSEMKKNDTLTGEYSYSAFFKKDLTIKDIPLTFKDKVLMFLSQLLFVEKEWATDRMESMIKIITDTDNTLSDYYDYVSTIESKITNNFKDKSIYDGLLNFVTQNVKDTNGLIDKVNSITKSSSLETVIFNNYNDIEKILKEIVLEDNSNDMLDKMYIYSIHIQKEPLEFIHTLNYINKQMSFVDYIVNGYSDITTLLSEHKRKDNSFMDDKLLLIRSE